ncbi:unnamed protein product [Closterium sp. NIES-65]|nr:unnamed protein product [Closterium sp. NIES-65]
MMMKHVCSEVLIKEQTLSIEQSYRQITSDTYAFSGAVNTVVATTGVNGKEGKGGREKMDKKKDGKQEKKRAPFKGHCYICSGEGYMAANCPNKKEDTTPAAAANVAEGDGKGVALTVACSAAKFLANDKDLWFLDSGCSQHMTGRKEWFTLTDKGENLRTEQGVTRIIASGGQVVATARHCHRLLCLDLKPWPASNGTTAAAACNGTVAASVCNGTTAGAACNGTVAAAACNGTAARAACNDTVAAVTCNGMTKAVANGVASLKTYAVGSKATPYLWNARLGHVHFDAVKWTATNGGVLGMDLEKGGEDMPCTSCHEANPLANHFRCTTSQRRSRPNKGVPPVRFQPSAMMAQDADYEDNPYDVAYFAEDDCDTDSDDEVEYSDEDEEEEGAWGGVTLDLAGALTGPEGKEWTLLLHQNAYVAKVQQRFFKGAPPKKQPITPLSSASFAKQDAGQFANRTMTEYLSILGMVQFATISTRPDLCFACNRLAAGAHLRSDAHWHELFRTLSYWAASPDMGLLFIGANGKMARAREAGEQGGVAGGGVGTHQPSWSALAINLNSQQPQWSMDYIRAHILEEDLRRRSVERSEEGAGYGVGGGKSGFKKKWKGKNKDNPKEDGGGGQGEVC